MGGEFWNFALGLTMRVENFMVKLEKLVVVDRQTTIQEASLKMVNSHVSSVVVASKVGDELHPEGLVSKTDVLKAVFVGGLSAADPVERIMSSNLVTITGDSERDEAAELIMKKKVHHLLVVSASGKLEGIVSAWDIAREVTLDGKAWPYNRSGFQ
eukprot:c1077_g1_i1.p1 GENE.c1077_g1_i1~~c1077_g1_i1.p1  ORF type:complete len:156 (-),score=22.70 c1077_g1_i1:65-532(-)